MMKQPAKSFRRAPLKKRRPSRREQGVALVMVLTVVAVITMFVSEMTQNTTTSFQVAVSERDQLKAEYIAKSGLNLTRLLIAKEPQIRMAISPIYQMLAGHRPPQINVWRFADSILAPFANLQAAKQSMPTTGIDFSQMRGLTDTGGTFEITTQPENTMLNLNDPLFLSGNDAARSVAMQLYALMGGFQTNSPFDSMFNTLDPDGQATTRLDIVSDVVDWWDSALNEQRTIFDPGSLQVTSAGGEDDIYSRFTDPYRVKNAPFDSLEELRMIRGVSDDFWATFVQTDPEDPRTRRVTVYGSGAVNPNEARPEVLLARLCSYSGISIQPLCQEPAQAMAFTVLFSTVRMLMPISLFETGDAFLQFMQGKGEMYSMLAAFPMAKTLLQWQPITIPADVAPQMGKAFITSAAIFSIQSIGRVGHTTVRMNSVVNFDPGWQPPQMTTAKMSGLGIFIHYRLD